MKRVVVTGLGAITPVGNDVDTMWKNMVDGVCGIDYITKFDTTDYKVKVAAEIKDFDVTKYVEAREARRLDLYTQYAIAAATQAVIDSGLYVDGEIKGIDEERFGVYFGSGIGGMETFINETTKLIEGGPRRVSAFFIPMMISNIAAGNIAIKFNAQGPCLPVVTACATGTNAIGEAFRTVQGGCADAIIAGGAEATINGLSVAGFTNCKALSTRQDPKDISNPFDKRRDGFVMGEGSGAIILEEYVHAKKRGAKIYAEIIGYANTCDAYHVTAPHPEAIGGGKAISQALKQAHYSEDQKVYINAHGTSTPLNDKSETLAIKYALKDKAYDALISSTKSMTGHMLGAAGAVEAIVAIKVLNEGVVPPTIGYKEKDEDCDLDYVPNVARKADVDIAASVSLGFGGHNGCIVFKKAE